MPVISFDVFDTLLTRTCAEPHDLFLHLGERLAANRMLKISPSDFAQARHRAEREARRRAPKNEVVLDDIYHELAARMGWDKSQREAVQAMEITLETEGIRPVTARRAEVALARATAGRVIFISDMYLPSTVIREWLAAAGFWQPGDLLFVSGEAGVCKGTGELFGKIRAELGVDFKSWEHHGDHPRSDRAHPERLGMTARGQLAARLAPREKILRGDSQFASGWRSSLAGAARLARLDQPAPDDDPRRRVLWATGAGVAGPLFYGFTEWCLAEAERRGIEDLYFLARGGQIFLQIAREIQAARPRPIRLHYLPVSRLALIGTADFEHAERLRSLVAPRLVFHSARQACINVALALDNWPAPPWLPATEWDRNLTPSEREQLADWLLAPAQLPQVQAALRERREHVHLYLRQQGLHPQIRAGLVDTGWMGTIQHQLEFAIGPGETPTAVTGFYLGTNAPHSSPCAGPVLAYSELLSLQPLARVHPPRVLIELMARADHGAVIAYAGNDTASLNPQLGSMDEATAEEVRFFQKGVLAFTRHALAAGPVLAAAPPVALAGAVTQNFAAFYEQPTLEEVLLFGRLPHSDQLLEQRFAVLCPPMELPELVTAMSDWRRRPPCWWLAGQARLGHATLLHFYLALKKIKWRLQSAFARGH